MIVAVLVRTEKVIIAISNKAEVFGKFFQVAEGHAHCHDAGADTAVIRHLVANDGTFGGIHDEPDIGLDATDFDVGLISGKGITGTIIIVVYKGFDADGGCFTVVGDLLVGDLDVIQVLESLGGFSEGEAKIHMQSQAQGHDMGIKLAEFQGGSGFRQEKSWYCIPCI